MNSSNLVRFVLLLFCTSTFSQTHSPGGVSGAEMWYQVSHTDLDQGIYQNSVNSTITLASSCGAFGSHAYFNFNPSVDTQQLCLFFNTTMENTLSRNAFFVGEFQNDQINYSHLTTEWNQNLGSYIPADSLVKNRFNFSTKLSYFNKRLLSYETGHASVNFYHWNMYQTDRKYKSYGFEGETSFFIGKEFAHSDAEGQNFTGNFPEFISYPFELTENQKNRVESYLALKYGVTLDGSKSYRNAKNLIFWNTSNNSLFKNRIFGIGRDDISGLNQLMSESVHEKDLLVKSVDILEDNNVVKQGTTSIKDNHFIVSADDGSGFGLGDYIAQHVRPLKRKWLAQIKGDEADSIPIYLKLNISGQISNELRNDSQLKLWMLHDKRTTNKKISDYSSQYVDYNSPINPGSNDFAVFKDIYFDTDKNGYDQYTFAVGPEMIIQLRFDDLCAENGGAAKVVISGGSAPYHVTINSIRGFYETGDTNTSDYPFYGSLPDSFTVTVTDANGLYQEIVVEPIHYLMEASLGDDRVLNSDYPSISLDAGPHIADPNATYKWFKDGVLLENDGFSIGDITEPGEYSVEVTSEDGNCVTTDTVVLTYSLTGSMSILYGCGSPSSSAFELNIYGGSPPFTTVITGQGQTVYQVHNDNYIVFTNIDYGWRTVTTTDSKGSVYQESIFLPDFLEGIALNIKDQVAQASTLLSPMPYPIFTGVNFTELNAGLLVTNPNVSYEWFMNGQSTGLYTPIVSWYQDDIAFPGDESGFNEIKVVVKNLDTGCTLSETVGAVQFWGVGPGKGAIQRIATTEDQPEETQQSTDEDIDNTITHKVYPNPSEAGATFYYEVQSGKDFSGTIEIFSPTGALLRQETVGGSSSYKLSFNLSTAGVYLIRTSVNGELLTDKIIIK